MIPYVVLFVVLSFGGLLEVADTTPKGKLNFKKYVFWSVIIILCMGIFKESTMGVDSETYYIYYWTKLDEYPWSQLISDFSIDNGFFITLKVIAIFTDDWWVAQAILFVITFILYYLVIRKESPYPTVSLLIIAGLSMITLMFGILRQALAGALCFIAYRYINKNECFRGLILIIMAATIHKSSIICICMLVIYFLKLKKFTGIRLIVCSAVVYILFLLFIPLITLHYADARYDGFVVSEGGYGMLLFMIVVIALILYLIYVTQSNTEYDLVYLYNLSCGALFIQIGALQWSLLSRMTVFFSIFWCLLIPKLLYKLPQKERIQCYIIIMILFGFMFFYQLTEKDIFVLHEFY